MLIYAVLHTYLTWHDAEVCTTRRRGRIEARAFLN